MKWRTRSRWRKVGLEWVIPKHRWFAWHPVRVKDEWVWLEYVWRAGYDGDGYGDRWEYELQ
jgi:hypothetical protein